MDILAPVQCILRTDFVHLTRFGAEGVAKPMVDKRFRVGARFAGG
jgi:hypothetical protein